MTDAQWLLKEAGWTVDSFDGGPTLGRPPVGIRIDVADPGHPPSRAIHLQQALRIAGLSAEIRDFGPNKGREDMVRLLVGVKP